jgi:hypothetical protein
MFDRERTLVSPSPATSDGAASGIKRAELLVPLTGEHLLAAPTQSPPVGAKRTHPCRRSMLMLGPNRATTGGPHLMYQLPPFREEGLEVPARAHPRGPAGLMICSGLDGVLANPSPVGTYRASLSLEHSERQRGSG